MTENSLKENVNDTLGKLFKDTFNSEVTSSESLYPHGSDRKIIRLRSSEAPSVVGIYNENILENLAFLSFSKHFKSSGLNIPQIFSVSPDNTSYLMEDLGDITLFKKICDDKVRFSNENVGLYKKAIENLVEFQTTAGKGIDYSLCYQFDKFGEDNIRFDLNYFKQRFLGSFYNKELDNEKLENDLTFLTKKLLEQPRNYFLYRDFQSRNIMLHKNDLYFIDYQSGRKGALQYDIASLLYDARADVPQELREELLDFYIAAVKKNVKIDSKSFKQYFWYFAMIRILQALGAYGYVGITKGRKDFLQSIPYALKNINFILNNKIEKGKLEYLRNILSEINYETAQN
jgi:aminoglycoside/choline kinase family phosphotransferase